MSKDYGNLRTPAARHIALTIALVMGLSACGDAEWEKQGYESEEVFEQALAGGFHSRADFNAAQKYQVTTKSEWDALNQTVSDGGFASIDAMREAAELGYSTQAEVEAAEREKTCVATASHGEVCLLVDDQDWSAEAVEYSFMGKQINRQSLHEAGVQYVRKDGTPLDFVEVALEYEIAAAERNIEESMIDFAFECFFDQPAYPGYKPWKSWVVLANPRLISVKHWLFGGVIKDKDGRYDGDVLHRYGESSTRLTTGVANEGAVLVIGDRGQTQHGRPALYESASIETDEEQYQIYWDYASLERNAKGDRSMRKLTIDRKTAKATIKTAGEKSAFGACKKYQGDIKKRVESDILPQVAEVTKWSVAEVSKAREKEAQDKAERDAREEMETVL